MAAASEIFSLDQSYDDFNVDELLNIDSSLLMSFLEDSHAEEGGNDEMLRAMIQSLDSEITNQDSCSETCCSSEDYSSEECRFSEVDDEVECCSTSVEQNANFEWIDMEMDYSCPNYEMTGYYIGRFTENMAEVGGLEDYSQVCYGNGMAMEEDDYIGLWQ